MVSKVGGHAGEEGSPEKVGYNKLGNHGWGEKTWAWRPEGFKVKKGPQDWLRSPLAERNWTPGRVRGGTGGKEERTLESSYSFCYPRAHFLSFSRRDDSP